MWWNLVLRNAVVFRMLRLRRMYVLCSSMGWLPMSKLLWEPVAIACRLMWKVLELSCLLLEEIAIA